MIFRKIIKRLPKALSINLLHLLIIIIIAVMILSCDSSVGPNHTNFEPGPILFVSNKSGTWQLWSMEVDGSNVKQLTHDPDSPIFNARWSPDGTKIAFESYAPNINPPYDFTRAIYIMNEDGTGIRQITNPPTGFRMWGDGIMVWSPDGKKIAFRRHIPPEVAGYFVTFFVDLETGKEKWFHDRIWGVNGWFSDGEKLLISCCKSREMPVKLAIMDINGNILRELLSENWIYAILSQDGNKIALSFLEDLYILESDFNNLIQITSGIYRGFPQVFSPDGNRIIYIEEHESKYPGSPTPIRFRPRYLKIIDIITREEKDISPFNYRDGEFRVGGWRDR